LWFVILSRKQRTEHLSQFWAMYQLRYSCMGMIINKIGHITSEGSGAMRDGCTATYGIHGTGRKINPQG
jgi:hypothetical protein